MSDIAHVYIELCTFHGADELWRILVLSGSSGDGLDER